MALKDFESPKAVKPDHPRGVRLFVLVSLVSGTIGAATYFGPPASFGDFLYLVLASLQVAFLIGVGLALVLRILSSLSPWAKRMWRWLMW